MKMALDRVKISAKISPAELKYFSAVFVVIRLLDTFPHTAQYFRYELVVLLAYGLFMLVRSLGRIQEFFKKPLFLPLFLFVAIYAVNILLHFRDGFSTFVTNCGQLTMACLYFFVFFLQFSMMDSDERGDILRFLFRIYISAVLVISVVSLVMLLFQYEKECVVNGITYIMGVSQRTSGHQLYGITTNCTTLGGLCVTGTFASVISLHLNEKRYRRFYITSIVIFLLTFCAANAFACMLMMMTFAAGFVVCHYFTSMAEFHGTPRAKRICKLIFSALGVFLAVYVLYYAVQGAEASVVNLFERTRVSVCTVIEKMEDAIDDVLSSFESPAPPTDSPDSTNPAEKPPAEKPTPKPSLVIERTLSSSVNSGRIGIWTAALRKYVEHPIFGVTNENARVYVNGRLYENLHNGYLMLLVGSGIVGLGLIVLFGLMLLIKALRYISMQSGVIARHLSLLIASCMAILTGDLVNGNFVFGFSIDYVFLWMFLGEIYGIVYCNAPAMKWSLKEIKL